MKLEKKYNCIITGVGGQGTVLLSRLICGAATEKGFAVGGSETIGMAQRGGSVVSHVRIGERVLSPLVPYGKADVIIALEPAEAVRVLPYLGKDGEMFVLDRAVQPAGCELRGGRAYATFDMTSYLKENVEKLTVVNYQRLVGILGGAKAVNTAMLGAAVKKGVFPFCIQDVEKIIRERLPEKFWAVNTEALTCSV